MAGKKINGRIYRFMKNRVAMLPSNRKENSVIPDMTILENMQIAEHRLSRKKPVIFIQTVGPVIREKFVELRKRAQNTDK